jgi:hypothetical protein
MRCGIFYTESARLGSKMDRPALPRHEPIPLTDENSLTGRVRRYARLSTAMGGLAARLAGERYLGLRVDRGRHAAELKATLGGIKGKYSVPGRQRRELIAAARHQDPQRD